MIKTPSTLERRTRIQSAIALIVALALVAALALELDRALKGRRANTSGRKVVASLSGSMNAVERKLDREVLWDAVTLKESLYNRDAIRTGSGSEAKVRFDDGTELELGENSLVVLDRSDDRVGIQFLKGSVFARGNGENALEIETEKGRVRLGDASGSGKGGRSALALRSGGDGQGLEVTVAQGSAQMQTANGSTGLSANERGQFGNSGITTEKLALVLDLPVLNARYVGIQSSQSVRFSWHAADVSRQILRARVQVSQDAAFKKIQHEREVSVRDAASGKFDAAFALTEGNWFWRTVTSDAKGTKTDEISDTRTLRILRHQTVRLEAPGADARLSYFLERSPLRLQWAASAQNGAVDRVELSRTSDFKNPVRAVDVAGLNSSSNKERRFEVLPESSRIENAETLVDHALESGRWFWRVVSRYEGVGPDAKGVAEWPTVARAFDREQLDTLPTPELNLPANRSTVGVSDQKKNVELSWKGVDEAAFYRLVIATDAKLTDAVVDKRVSGVSWEGEVPTSGLLYWAVQAKVRPGQAGDSKLSEVRRFTLSREGGFRLVAPTKDQKLEFLEERPAVKFSWEDLTGARTYAIEWSDTSDFSHLSFTKTVAAARPEYVSRAGAETLPLGVQYWRVKAVNAADQIIAMSEVGRYQLRQQPPLIAPEKVAPAAQLQAEIDSTKEKRHLFNFEWKPVENAREYKFTLWRMTPSKSFEEELVKTLSADPAAAANATVKYERELAEGVYRWDVRAVDNAGRVGTVGLARLFELRQGDRLPAPVIESPQDGALVESSSPEIITLAWEKIPGARKYLVKIYELGLKGAKRLVTQAQTEKPYFKTPETLASGQYHWEVSAFGLPPAFEDQPGRKPALGRLGSAGFRVHWIGVLNAPARLTIRMETDRTPASHRAKTVPQRLIQNISPNIRPKGASK